MGYSRGPNFQTLPLNVVGSSVFGIYTKQSTERTYNLTISDNWLVPYLGYKIGLDSSNFKNATEGRGFYQSIRLNKIFAVFDDTVYKIDVTYDHVTQQLTNTDVQIIGTLDTKAGIVYISENNKPQILFSDGTKLYLYDPQISAGIDQFTVDLTGTAENMVFSGEVQFAVGEPLNLFSTGSLPTITTSPALSSSTTYYVANPSFDNNTNTTKINIARTATDAFNNTNIIVFSSAGTGTLTTQTYSFFQDIPTDFTPGFITFHDTYFLVAAKNDTFYTPPAQNTWRLSGQNNGFVWPSDAQHVGLLESKTDIIQAVTRFPSRGNMILVMGKAVTEFWFDTGNQLFPYQRQNQSSIDYGCVSPATVATLDEIVVWLGMNEKSGPIVMYTTGGEPTKITTDGIDFQLSQINTPEDSQGFLFRKNGHLFYHLNFYTDNFSFVFDLTENKIFNASDETGDYYIMGQAVWYKNQYFSISKNTGNLYIFDTVFNYYESVNSDGSRTQNEVPRTRVTQNIRLPSQNYFIVNDVGFTVETGESNYLYQDQGPIFLLTEDGNKLITEQVIGFPFLLFENGNFWVTEDNNSIIGETIVTGDTGYLIAEQNDIVPVTPRIDLAVSYDGGATFSSKYPYNLFPIGKRRNKLIWWNIGAGNDVVFSFNFWNIGAVVADSGEVNIRT